MLTLCVVCGWDVFLSVILSPLVVVDGLGSRSAGTTRRANFPNMYG